MPTYKVTVHRVQKITVEIEAQSMSSIRKLADSDDGQDLLSDLAMGNGATDHYMRYEIKSIKQARIK